MSDRFEQDPEETAQILRRARARDAQVWGNKVATADVTPGMIRHVDLPARCICDACAGTRPQPTLPVSLSLSVLVNRSKFHRTLALDDGSIPALEERGPTRRAPHRWGKPKTAPPGSYSGRFGSRLWG